MASFIFGGDTGETPESLKRKRELVNALLSQQIGTPRTVGEGLSALGKGLSGYLAGTSFAKREKQAEDAGKASANSAFNVLLSGAGSPSAPSVPSETPQGSGPTAALSGENTPVYSDFIGSVKGGGVTNPYALAAIAATGRAESSFSPGNANRTWDDGTNDAGGILSWNGPRLQNLMAFARHNGESGLGSPQTQAQFFLQENPQLIASLNSAGSLQEAQSLMNNAWRFKGYDQPGGEAARRLAYAQAYLPNFQGEGASPAVAAIQKASPLPMPGAAAQMAIPDPLVSNPSQTASLSPQGVQQPAPPLEAPRTVATPPAPAAQPMAAPGPDMQALSQQFGGSQQLANADPRKGILTALLSGQQNGKAGFPSAPGQGGSQSGNPTMQALMKAMSNPWLNEGQKAVVGALLKQEIAKSDPNNALDTEYKRAQIDKLHADAAKASNPLADQKYGLNPQYGVDANGNPVILQLGNNGVATQTALPNGVKLSKEPIKLDAGTEWILLDPITRQAVGSIPKNVGEAEAAKARGKAQGELSATLPTDMLSSAQTVQQIDQLLANPGLDSIVGPVDQYRPTWSLGDSGRDALARYNQLKGKSFLQAYATLKGGGQITEVEGKKAEDAMARMDRAQGETEFRTALKDFRDAVLTGQRKLLEKAGIPHDQWGRYLPQEAPQGNSAVKINGYTIQEVQ